MTDGPDIPTLERLSRFATRHKVFILLLTLIVVSGFAAGMFRVQGEVILGELLPYEHPFRRFRDRWFLGRDPG